MSSWRPDIHWFSHLDFKFDKQQDVVILTTKIEMPRAKSFQACMEHFRDALGEKTDWLSARNYTSLVKIFALENHASFDVSFTLAVTMTPEQRTEYYLRWA